ncbi:MAG TPA: polysaccharide pyruvyl transferase family protein [Burkholderiales bacterium]|nr:polysaccharide pyruvyl transferase family protein [Burkholderiales bacterium]
MNFAAEPDRPRGAARPAIALFGEWNTANLGDRAIHECAMRFFEECGWEVRSFALGSLAPADPGLPAHASGHTANAVGATLSRFRPGLKRALRGVRQRLRMARLAPQLENVQAIAVGGGALLSDANLHFPQSLSALAECAQALGKPVYCLGCSAEGDWSRQGEQMISEFLAGCGIVAVRDDGTAVRLAGPLGVPPPVFGDFCLQAPGADGSSRVGAASRDIALNACRLPGPWATAQGRYERALVTAAQRLAGGSAARPPGRLRIFTTGPGDDAVVARRVHARLESCGAALCLPENLAELSALMQRSGIVLAARLHGAILALANGIPVIGLSPAPKLHNFLSTMGIGRHCYELYELHDLLEWFDATDNEAIAVEQRRALAESRVWGVQEQVRRQLVRSAVERRCA